MPYCSRIFAYSQASACAPRAAPTRSARGDQRERQPAPAARQIAGGPSARSAQPGSGRPARARPLGGHTVVRQRQSAPYPRASIARSPPRWSPRDRSRRRRRQVVGEHRAEERDVDQAAPELLGDDGHLDAGGAVGPQRSPARRSICLSSRAIRSSSSRSCTDPGPRSSASLAAASRSCRCSAGQTYIHSAPSALGAAPFPKAAEVFRRRTRPGSAVCRTPAAPRPAR